MRRSLHKAGIHRPLQAGIADGANSGIAARLRGRTGSVRVHFKRLPFLHRHGGTTDTRIHWRALWKLGEAQANTDSALDAFVKRQARVDSLARASPDQVCWVIEALRAWCARAGFDVPETAGGPETTAAVRSCSSPTCCRSGSQEQYDQPLTNQSNPA